MLYYCIKSKEVIIVIAITLQNRTSLFLPFSCLSSLQTLNKTFVLYRTHHGMSVVYCHIELSFLIFCSSEQPLIKVHQQEKKGLVYFYLYIIANDLRQASWCFRFDKKNPLLYLVILQLAGALCYAHAYIRGLLVERIKDNLLRELMIDVPPQTRYTAILDILRIMAFFN